MICPLLVSVHGSLAVPIGPNTSIERFQASTRGIPIPARSTALALMTIGCGAIVDSRLPPPAVSNGAFPEAAERQFCPRCCWRAPCLIAAPSDSREQAIPLGLVEQFVSRLLRKSA